MTQQQLGQRAGVGLRQIRECETGAGEISAGRIWNIAAALEVPVSFFFEGLDGQAPARREARGKILTDEETLGLVRANYVLPAEVPDRAPGHRMPPIANDRFRPITPPQAVAATRPVAAPVYRTSRGAHEPAQTFASYCSDRGLAVVAPLFAASRMPEK